MLLPQLLGVAVIALAVYAVARQYEVRITLLLTALVLGLLAGNPFPVFKAFLATFSNERFVVPICTAMGFAYVLRHTGCDQHLVHLLVRPLTKVRPLLIPGTVLVGFLVNMPVVSQTSTAATIGPVVIPILRAANISPVTTGAALVLGCSVGGELLNPGAPELRATVEESKKAAVRWNEEHPDEPIDPEQYDTQRCVRQILPLNVVCLIASTAVFWLMSLGGTKVAGDETPPGPPEGFTINPVKAMVPLIPLALLYLTAPPLEAFEVPKHWLDAPDAPPGRFESRLIGAAMILGTAVAALVTPRKALESATAFFEGAGYGFTHIISLIVTANCFGAAIEEIGFAAAVAGLTQTQPTLMFLTAWLLPLAFAALCGSGMAATQSLIGFFTYPALLAGIDPTHLGAVVSISSAAGRTMSPVAAVMLLSASMTGTNPLHVSRRVALPLLVGTAAMALAALLLAPAP